MEPRILFFDDPTSARGSEQVGEVLDVMCDLAGAGMTMFVVIHEMGFAREVATDLLFMDDGIVVEAGTLAKCFPIHENPAPKSSSQESSDGDLSDD